MFISHFSVKREYRSTYRMRQYDVIYDIIVMHAVLFYIISNIDSKDLFKNNFVNVHYNMTVLVLVGKDIIFFHRLD